MGEIWEIGKEKDLFDEWAREHIAISGPMITAWSIIRARNYDPVYGEHTDGYHVSEFDDPLQFRAAIEFVQAESSELTVGDEGEYTDFNAIAWVSKKELDINCASVPKKADVWRVWNAMYAEETYFTVEDSEPTESVGIDVGISTVFKVELKAYGRFDAERKLGIAP